MLAYIPEIYPDELISSWIARWKCHIGLLTHSQILGLIARKQSRVSTEFAVRFNDDVVNAVRQRYGDVSMFLLNHTMLPYYICFTDSHFRSKAVERVKQTGLVDISDYLIIDRVAVRHLRYCSICAIEDRSTYGEAFYHRAHQLWDVSVCAKHGCLLRKTRVSISGSNPPNADMEIPYNDSLERSGNKMQLGYSRYVVGALTLGSAKDDYIQQLRLISSKYTLWSSNIVDYDRIVSAIREYYTDSLVNLPTAWQIESVVRGYRCDSRIILMLLYMGRVYVES